MHHQALCALIEALLKTAKKHSLNQQLLQASLDGRSLSLHIDKLDAPICFNFVDQDILVSAHLNEATDCSIHLALSSLTQLKNTSNLTKLIKEEKLDVEGDLKVAQGFASFLESIDIDWRSEVANVIGDVATFKLERLVCTLQQKIAFAREQVSADASEWLIHEKRLVVSGSELNSLYESVRQCQSKTEQLALRIDALHAKLTGTTH